MFLQSYLVLGKSIQRPRQHLFTSRVVKLWNWMFKWTDLVKDVIYKCINLYQIVAWMLLQKRKLHCWSCCCRCLGGAKRSCPWEWSYSAKRRWCWCWWTGWRHRDLDSEMNTKSRVRSLPARKAAFRCLWMDHRCLFEKKSIKQSEQWNESLTVRAELLQYQLTNLIHFGWSFLAHPSKRIFPLLHKLNF